MKLEVCQLGKIPYNEALKIQEKLLLLRQKQVIGDLMLLLEHPPVLTIGKKGKAKAADHIKVTKKWLEEHQIQVHYVNRGGDVTYHGPGQVVGYPIIDLTNHGRDIRSFIHHIEQVFIELLSRYYQVPAYRDPNYTGVWVEQGKITAIGFAIKRWVSMHGFAFNVNPDLSHFNWIVPCGIRGKTVCSLQQLLEHEIDLTTVNRQIISCFAEIFSYQLEIITPAKIYHYIGRLNTQ